MFKIVFKVDLFLNTSCFYDKTMCPQHLVKEELNIILNDRQLVKLKFLSAVSASTAIQHFQVCLMTHSPLAIVVHHCRTNNRLILFQRFFQKNDKVRFQFWLYIFFTDLQILAMYVQKTFHLYIYRILNT